MIRKHLIKAIDLLLFWLSLEIKEMEGNDELWMFFQDLRTDLNKLNKMLKEKEQQYDE